MIEHSDEHRPSAAEVPEVEKSNLLLNRELSWLRFNLRVLEEAEDKRHPLLERVKFLTIFATNLDEFFMVRVSGLRRQVATGTGGLSPDGMTASEQILAINQELLVLSERYDLCWKQDILPALQEAGIHVLHYGELTQRERQAIQRYFHREIFPVLTPLAFDPTHPFPHISNLSFNLAVLVKDPERGDCFARVKVPDIFPRLVPISTEEDVALQQMGLGAAGKVQRFVWLEEVIAHNLENLFPGLQVVESYPFRVTRDADVVIEEDEASDLIEAVEEQLDQRDFNSAVRLELDAATPVDIRELLTRNLQLPAYLVYAGASPIGMAGVRELYALERPDLKDPPFIPSIPSYVSGSGSLFATIRQQNVLLYHPYDSFMPIVDFIRLAANDPDVLAIKQTLYRVNPKSPIIDALMEARVNGKQVAVLVELKARFDEENNIEWARKLEDEGVHVVYGVRGLKTHAKVCLIVRREPDGIYRYTHLGTGNYNVVTSRIYTDVSYLTCDPDITRDISDLFNSLTGYSRKNSYSKLLVAPATLRQQLLERIERETCRHRQHGDGYIAFKMNALVDTQCIQALYRSAQAGVRIDLQVRGICCLRPGISGISETITVTSVVGRFLEHARVYYFRHGGQHEVLVGSADLMPRNLDQRVEVLFPVEDPRCREIIIDDILGIGLRDNVHARRLCSDGSYVRVQPAEGETMVNSQEWFLNQWKPRL